MTTFTPAIRQNAFSERARRRWVALLLTTALSGVGSAAIAQTAATPSTAPPTGPGPAATTPTASNRIGEVIVTANRRSENIQRSSLAIQAFSSQTVRAAGVNQATDLNKIVPDLQIATNGADTQIYIRGVGDFSGTPLSNSGVAFNVDGVYVGRSDAVSPNFYDISRLEVVKGPQGTLYGRNSTGGAINLITANPTFDELKGYVNTEIGTYNLFRIETAVNVPVSDTLALRAAFNDISRSGYLSDGTNDDKETEGRVKLLWRPTPKTSLLVTVDGANEGGKGGGYVYLPKAPGADPWDAESSSLNNAYLASFKPVGPLITPQGTDSKLRGNFADASAQLDQDLGFATLTVLPAFRYSDVAALSYKDQRQYTTEIDKQYTLETRLANSTPRLKWVVGAFFFNDNDPGQTQVLVSPAILNSHLVYDPNDRSYAVFGETTYSVTDRLRIILGGRYTSETKTLGGQYFNTPLGGTANLLESFGGKLTFSDTTWKAGLEYDVTSASMLYFTASTGFKAGGINQTVAPNNTYQPEKITAYEFGSRNRFFDNRLQVNIEGFYWDYTNQQNTHITFDNAGNIAFLTQDAGEAEIYGANVDVVAKLTAFDTLHLIAEYDHSRYDSFTYDVPTRFYSPIATACKAGASMPGPYQPLTPIDCSGFSLPHDPEWTGSVDYDHTFGLGERGTLDFDVNARFASSTYLAVDFSPQEKAPSYAIVNVALTYRPIGARWSLSAYGRNLNDGTQYTGGQESQQVPQLFSAVIAAPRTFGVQLGVTF